MRIHAHNLSGLRPSCCTCTPGAVSVGEHRACWTVVVHAALAMQLLQQRILLGVIEGGEDSVDLGALLTRLGAVTPAGTLKDKINAATAAYRAMVVRFQHDGILPDVSEPFARQAAQHRQASVRPADAAWWHGMAKFRLADANHSGMVTLCACATRHLTGMCQLHNSNMAVGSYYEFVTQVAR